MSIESIIALGEWLSKFPYENISKRFRQEPRGPVEMKEAWRKRSAGGTCFSLVNLGAAKANNDFNLEPRYYLGDRPRGENRHCVLGFPKAGVFLDPGYLCFGPLPLSPENVYRLKRPQNILQLNPMAENRLKVQTERKEQLTWRYTLKNHPVSRDRFESAWKESFHWDSFTDSFVMTRQRDNDMLLYLNGTIESISRDRRKKIIPPEKTSEKDFLSKKFGVGHELIEQANLEITR